MAWYLSLLRQHSIMSTRLFRYNSSLTYSFGIMWSALLCNATGSYSFELNTTDSATATQLTQQIVELSLLTHDKVCKHFHHTDSQKYLEEIKIPPLFITEDRHNASILRLFQQDFILYSLWYMQAQEQINQKFSGLIGKKQIGSCQNPGMYVLLSSISFCSQRNSPNYRKAVDSIHCPPPTPHFLANIFIFTWFNNQTKIRKYTLRNVTPSPPLVIRSLNREAC